MAVTSLDASRSSVSYAGRRSVEKQVEAVGSRSLSGPFRWIFMVALRRPPMGAWCKRVHNRAASS